MEFDFTSEFGVIENMRIVIHDNKLKQFVLIEEIEDLQKLMIKESELPKHEDWLIKFQQLKEEKWHDASRYLRIEYQDGED